MRSIQTERVDLELVSLQLTVPPAIVDFGVRCEHVDEFRGMARA